MDKKYCDIPKIDTDKTDTMAVPAKPMESAGVLDFIDHLTETERKYYFALLEIIQTPRFGLDRETAERKAGAIIARYRQQLQLEQAAKDYQRDGYIRIFSAVLKQAIYLVRDEKAASQVPDRSLPVFTSASVESLKGLKPSEALVLMEAKILLGGRIKITQLEGKQDA